MEKTFDVTAIAKTMLVRKGIIYNIGTQFQARMTEEELNSLKDFIRIVECKEDSDTITAKEEIVVEVASKSEPVIEPESEEVKPKGEKNELQRKSTNNASKNKHKAKV